MINEGKLAMVLGVEVSEVLNCGQTLDVPHCTTTQIDAELDRLESVGVRSFFPIHKFDNALGGVKFDGGTTGVLVNTGNKYATGKFWTAEHCEDPDHDNQPADPTQGHAHTFSQFLDPVLTQPLFEGQLPIYPPPPICNPKGLTRPGRVRDPADDGPRHDHRDRPHEHEGAPRDDGDPRGGELRRRHLEPQLGRPRQPEAHPAARRPDRADLAPRRTASSRSGARSSKPDPHYFFGVGFGSDINGLHSQPHRGRTRRRTPCSTRSCRSTAGASIDRQRSGTRVYDINTDGVDHYGLYPDWIEDMRGSPAARSWRTWPTAPRPTCRCGSARRRPRVPRWTRLCPGVSDVSRRRRMWRLRTRRRVRPQRGAHAGELRLPGLWSVAAVPPPGERDNRGVRPARLCRSPKLLDQDSVRELAIYEPGIVGPFRSPLAALAGLLSIPTTGRTSPRARSTRECAVRTCAA